MCSGLRTAKSSCLVTARVKSKSMTAMAHTMYVRSYHPVLHSHAFLCLQCKLGIHCLSNVTGLVQLSAVEWYCGSGGYVQPNCPVLAVAFDNGRAQLMRHELDDSE